MTDFQYDIAFSFTKEDEGVATQINDLLRDRYETFLYSRAQEKLAGTDGEKMFNAVFKGRGQVRSGAAPRQVGKHAVDQLAQQRASERGSAQQGCSSRWVGLADNL